MSYEKSFIRVYFDFMRADFEGSLLEGRCYQAIDMFRIALIRVYDNDNDLKRTLINLNNFIQEYRDKYNSIPEDINFINDLLSEELLKYIRKDFIIFVNAYNFLYTIKCKDEYTLFDGLLIEFHNALSHIITAMRNYAIDKALYSQNVSRAQGHLYRATLNSYKEIIKHYKDNIINSVELYNEYVEIRANEIDIIGTKENKKNKKKLVFDYHKFCFKLYKM